MIPQNHVPLDHHASDGTANGQEGLHSRVVPHRGVHVESLGDGLDSLLIHSERVEDDLRRPKLRHLLLEQGLPSEKFPLFDGALVSQNDGPLVVFLAQLRLGVRSKERRLCPGELRGVESHHDLARDHPGTQIHHPFRDLARHQGGDLRGPVPVHREDARELDLR
jgi:hypothetical protein